MKVLIIGNGAREHCLTYKVSQSTRVKHIYCAPGNAGTHKIAKNIDISPEDIDSILAFAKKESIDLTVVGPEIPLSLGIKDVFTNNGLALFGPDKFCSRLESSKSFAKEIMQLQSIPTPEYETFNHEEIDAALNYIKTCRYPLVIKADGLAAGKGVNICNSIADSAKAVQDNLKNAIHGKSSSRIIIEEFIEGHEASFMCIINGEDIIPLPTSEDYKRAYDNNQGPNTGGMGSYSPSIALTKEQEIKIINHIFKPMIKGISLTGEQYSGVLYAGLMIQNEQIKVLEFNVRFGDPETQSVLVRLESDIIDIFEKVSTGKLNEVKPAWSRKPSLSVVLASKGYPGIYKKHIPISGLNSSFPCNTFIFHAGTACKNGETITNGGRVLTITNKGETLAQCRNDVYNAIDKIKFDGLFYRKDIGLKAIDD